MRVTPVQILTNGNMANSLTSQVQQLNQQFGYAVQADYATSGTLGGTLSLQASVDHQQDKFGNVINAGTFVTIANTPVTLSGAGSFIWNITSAMYPYVQLIYTPANGDSGTLNAYFFGRGF